MWYEYTGLSTFLRKRIVLGKRRWVWANQMRPDKGGVWSPAEKLKMAAETNYRRSSSSSSFPFSFFFFLDQEANMIKKTVRVISLTLLWGSIGKWRAEQCRNRSLSLTASGGRNSTILTYEMYSHNVGGETDTFNTKLINTHSPDVGWDLLSHGLNPKSRPSWMSNFCFCFCSYPLTIYTQNPIPSLISINYTCSLSIWWVYFNFLSNWGSMENDRRTIHNLLFTANALPPGLPSAPHFSFPELLARASYLAPFLWSASYNSLLPQFFFAPKYHTQTNQSANKQRGR